MPRTHRDRLLAAARDTYTTQRTTAKDDKSIADSPQARAIAQYQLDVANAALKLINAVPPLSTANPRCPAPVRDRSTHHETLKEKCVEHDLPALAQAGRRHRCRARGSGHHRCRHRQRRRPTPTGVEPQIIGGGKASEPYPWMATLAL
jgi:hypothetical protein